jgi:hypothetical protein
LAANSVVHFRVSATNATGTSVGSDATFKTHARPEAAPEFGRCVAVPGEKQGVKTVYHGGFLANTCLAPSSTHTGKYEWLGGVSKTGLSLAGSAATLETVGKTKVTCKGVLAAGQYSGRDALSGVSLQLTGCEQAGRACATAGQASGTLTSQPLEGVLGWQSRSLKKVALALYPVGRSGPFMRFTCAAAGAVTVEGTLLVPVQAGKMLSSSSLIFKARGGKQTPESFEGAPREVLLSSVAGKAAEQLGATMTLTQVSEESVEVNTFV